MGDDAIHDRTLLREQPLSFKGNRLDLAVKRSLGNDHLFQVLNDGPSVTLHIVVKGLYTDAFLIPCIREPDLTFFEKFFNKPFKVFFRHSLPHMNVKKVCFRDIKKGYIDWIHPPVFPDTVP